MSSHLERTEHIPRSNFKARATVVDVWKESKTVKGLTLFIEDKDRFHFKPGQWVDVFIPGVSVVGGFSITSTPKRLKDSSTIQLAIKKSEDPPAAWVHNECHIGSQISLCCGGDFFYDGSRRSLADLLLIAGGVGITPVASIVQHAIELREESDKNQTSPAVNQIVLLYSAVEKDELLFEVRFKAEIL
jgi:ferredoxin-NADP reductase